MSFIAKIRFTFLLALCAVCAHAQQSGLTGTVTDTTGAVIVAADVTVLNSSTGVQFAAQSNESGAFNFPLLQPGTYELFCESVGFKTYHQSGIVMETGLTKTVGIQMEIGEITETIEVTGSAPLLETENTTVGQFIERTTVAQMPVGSRQAGQLIKLAGNVTFARSGGGLYDLPFFSMAGGRSRNQMWHLDGGVVQNMALGIAQLNLNPPVESLREFKVESNNYAAEFGRTGNGLIIMSTRSGTNEFHGAVYHNFRNDALDTRTFFAPSIAPLRYNIFGGSLGGPIKKDKSFFFFNYEGQRRSDGATIANTDVPHPVEIGGDFSNRNNFTLMDPREGIPFENNTIPESRMDALGRTFASFYPAPNNPSPLTSAPRDNYVKNVSNRGVSDFITAKVDHNFGPNDRISSRFSNVTAPAWPAPVYPNEFADFRGSLQTRSNLVSTSTWNHNFTTTMVNEFRYTFGNRTFTTRGLGRESGKNGELGIPNVDAEFFPTVNLVGYTRLGAGNQERIQKPIRTHQVVNNTSWFKGAHSLKWGMEYRYSRNQDDFNQFAGGSYTFNNRAAGDALAQLLLGWTTRGQLVDTDILNTRSDYWGAYVQDSWKATDKLTVNLGVRWDVDTPRWELSNNQSGFDPVGINPVCECPGVMTFAGRNGQSKYAHDFDMNNFGPRIGLAYRAGRSTVIRAGYGVNYNGAYARAVPFTQFWTFSKTLDINSPDGGFTPAFMLSDGLPAVTPFSDADRVGTFGAVTSGRRTVSPDFFQRDQLNGYSQQWNFTLQKQLPDNMLLEAQYQANVGHKLGGANYNLNMIPLVGGRGPDQQSQTQRMFPQYNSVVHESPSWGNSTYHSLNLKAEKRFSQGLSYLINYTWSKFIDDVESANELGGEQNNGYTHFELRHLDKALSGNDIRHRIVASGVYELPVGRGKPLAVENPVVQGIVGGWSLGVIAEFRTGSPYGIIEQTNRSNAFSHGQRPNVLGDHTLSGSRSKGERLLRWFDTSQFEAPGVGVFGNSPRNVCCGPGFGVVDVSIQKRFAITERTRLEFRGDIFNVANHANFNIPERRRGNSGFGRIRGTIGTGRQTQLGLRLEF